MWFMEVILTVIQFDKLYYLLEQEQQINKTI